MSEEIIKKVQQFRHKTSTLKKLRAELDQITKRIADVDNDVAHLKEEILTEVCLSGNKEFVGAIQNNEREVCVVRIKVGHGDNHLIGHVLQLTKTTLHKFEKQQDKSRQIDI